MEFPFTGSKSSSKFELTAAEQLRMTGKPAKVTVKSTAGSISGSMSRGLGAESQTVCAGGPEYSNGI